MLLERIYDHDLSQASYLLGCQKTGEAIVVDPRRDIQEYLDLAARNGMRITAVTETHIHADYLSGSRELAHATDAILWVSAEGGPDWQYGFEAERLHDRDTIALGNITLQALHTPGHTPEHLSFLVTDGTVTTEPGYLLSGDFVFAGDLGRPDLLDEAAGGVDTRFEGARQLFASLRDVFLTLPDHVQVFPGHGAGSPCGKALGALPSTSVGYERLYSWWRRHLAAGDERGFIHELLDGQPDAHAYFGRMKHQNRQGPEVMGPRAALAEWDIATVAAGLDNGSLVLVDTRPVEAVHRGTVRDALSLPNPGKVASHGAWAYDPEQDSAPIVLLAEDGEKAHRLWDHLVRVGIDQVVGYVRSIEGLPSSTPLRLSPADLDSAGHVVLLDVRSKGEFADGHIPGARQLNAGKVLWNQDALPRQRVIVTYCQTGIRNSVAASALRRAGFTIAELEGSYAGWQAWASRSPEPSGTPVHDAGRAPTAEPVA
ncbi:MBL fold metallo-hydrolase [Citricoccus nitrophenolicus]|uniref:Hydroxyacylglutathione hydrolase n=1 Tax=Citricoccus muralis TaxID=169134 RepID=A0A3D9LBV2_9MICC|nr:MBL fold metallo-hydrolase [Citricoccus muralis]REE03136.1 hydroxyacylglutathione hydrolase [Citricoccus muralis]